jgi:DNA sulfur modification protein DndB
MCEVDYLNLGLSIPALRGSQGGRDIYVALPNNGVINTFFPTHIEASDASSAEAIDPDKVNRITDYISGKRDGYVLGAITYATDSDCEFDEVFPGAQFGVLRLPLNAKLRTIDGQHRREALRTAVEVLAEVAAEHTPLVLYVEPSLERRRAMFADMNAPSAELAPDSTSTADPFETTAIKLSTEHPFLVGRVTSSHRKTPAGRDDYELNEVIDALKRLFVGATGRVKMPARFRATDVEARGAEFFDTLANSQLGRLLHSGEDGSMAEWPPVLKVLAGAAWRLRFDELGPRLNLEQWVDSLDRVDFSSAGATWKTSGMSDGRARRQDVKRPQIIAAVDEIVREMTAPRATSQTQAPRREAALAQR